MVTFRVVGFIHDEFIIEIKENKDDIASILEIICESMEEVIKDIPISCEYKVSSCWESPDTRFNRNTREL